MANPEHVKLVTGDVDALRGWFRRGGEKQLPFDLSNARLRHFDIHKRVYESWLEDLRRESGSYADIREGESMWHRVVAPELTGMFRGADFSGATLIDPDFSELALDGASFDSATLYYANFMSTGLDHVDFRNAAFEHVVIASCDLSCVLNLDKVIHLGPSFIDTETLLYSGSIPDEFLRGMGVSEDLISYLPSLRGNLSPIEFYSCFISYSHKDEEFCKRLYSRMQQEKLRVWYAPEEVKAGRYLIDQVDQAIRVHDKFLLVLSEASMASDWVAIEIGRARQREDSEGKQVLFPIRLVPFESIRDWSRLDPRTAVRLSTELERYFIPDFSNWKDHDAFEAAFKRLVDDLKNDDKLRADKPL